MPRKVFSTILDVIGRNSFTDRITFQVLIKNVLESRKEDGYEDILAILPLARWYAMALLLGISILSILSSHGRAAVYCPVSGCCVSAERKQSRAECLVFSETSKVSTFTSVRREHVLQRKVLVSSSRHKNSCG